MNNYDEELSRLMSEINKNKFSEGKMNFFYLMGAFVLGIILHTLGVNAVIILCLMIGTGVWILSDMLCALKAALSIISLILIRDYETKKSQ